jgi:hypothetical protein
MKKILITLTFSCLMGATTTFAQKVNGVAVKDFTEDYIEISQIPSYGTIVQVAVDFGQKDNIWNYNTSKLTDDSGKPMELNSMIAALNLMSKNGYELVSTYSVKDGDRIIQHYILKKKKG